MIDQVEDLAPEEDLGSQPRCTDFGNARAFAESALGEKFRYVVEWECWISWTGKYWCRGGADLNVFAAVVLSAARSFTEAKTALDELTPKRPRIALEFGIGSKELSELDEKIAALMALVKWHTQSQNTAKASACIVQLKALLACTFEALDLDPWLLNCDNGTVDLRRGELRPHSREDFITRCLDIPFLPDRKAPYWEKFLRECMGDSTLLVLYLQRLVGYTLTASTQEHLLVFCYGGGSNGKSTFLKVLSSLLGPYGASTPRTLLFASKVGDVHPTELATLYGKRLGVCSEVGEDALIDEAKVKDLTGGDTISCRRMNEDFWEFAPTHKLWLAGNHKPAIKGTDDGIWRRLRVVPWNVQFRSASDSTNVSLAVQDKDLPARLADERVGILAWAVKGCTEWQRIGVCDPPEVLAATVSYRTQSDAMGEFFRSHLVFQSEAKMSAKALRTLYERWCEEMGHMAAGARRMGQRLRSLGVTDSTMRIDGKVCPAWVGVRQLADYEAR